MSNNNVNETGTPTGLALDTDRGIFELYITRNEREGRKVVVRLPEPEREEEV